MLTFSSGNLEVNPVSGAADSYALNTMRYLNFTDLFLGTKEYVQASKNMMLYPNLLILKVFREGIVTLEMHSSILATTVAGGVRQRPLRRPPGAVSYITIATIL